MIDFLAINDAAEDAGLRLVDSGPTLVWSGRSGLVYKVSVVVDLNDGTGLVTTKPLVGRTRTVHFLTLSHLVRWLRDPH